MDKAGSKEQDMTEDATQGTPEDGNDGEDAQERTFTQADLNKIAASEKRDGTKVGRQAAITELLEKTGAESIDDVLSGYTEYQTVQKVTETDAEKAKARAERLEKRAKAAEEKHANTLREFALRDALRDEGINTARLKLALKVADMSSLSVGEDGVSGVKDEVEALKEASPEWFEPEGRRRVDAPETSGGSTIPQGLQAQIEEARASGDHIVADRLNRRLLEQQGKVKFGG